MSYFETILKYNEYADDNMGIYTLQGRIDYLTDVLNNLGKPFIVGFTGIPEIKFSIKNNEGFYELERYLISLAKLEDDDAGWMEKLNTIANEDVEWTKKRNEGFNYTVCRKYILTPSVQAEAKKRIEEVLEELINFELKIKKKKEEEKIEREKFKSLYRMGKVYKKILPKGGEDGQDGFLDVDIVCNKTEETVRFIAKDIFDFGKFNFPKKYGGTDDVFFKEKWTEKEKEMSDWLREFGEFKGSIRM